MYSLKSECSFDAAHFLTDYKGSCENLHGHRWRVVASIQSEKLPNEGESRDMLVDFALFKSDLKEVCSSYDHTFIVEDGSLKQETINALKSETFKLKVVPWRTTAENFAMHIFRELCLFGYDVSYVKVYETPNNCAVYSK